MPDTQNTLIDALPRADRARLLGLLEPVELVLSQVLCEGGKKTRHAYFPTTAFVSLIAHIDAERELEVGMAGREGMVGEQLVLGVANEPLKAVVQGAGMAWRVAVVPFKRELLRSRPLRERLQRYVYVVMAQRAASAACLRFHEIGPRLARWLLMSQDRAHTDRFPMTQQFASMMLGVRRVGVTAAASALQERGLISYHRGDLTVLDRAGLERAACSCYAAGEALYAQHLRAPA